MIWKTPCPAEEGGVYPGCLGVKAGLNSEAYWLRLGPVWTNKAAVWSHLTTAPEACQGTFFFLRLSSSDYFHLCHRSTDLFCSALYLCVWSVWLSAVGGRRGHRKKVFLVQNISPSFPRHPASLLLVCANICFGLTVPGWPWHRATQHRLKTKGGCGKREAKGSWILHCNL